MREATKSLFLILITILPCLLLAQQPSFKATIGLSTYNVKNGDVLRVCKGETITYENTVVNYSSLSWRYNNGTQNVSTDNIFSVIYNNTGSKFYTVQIINDNTPFEDSLKVTVVVSEKEPNLKAAFNYDPATVSCASSLHSFDAATSTGSGLSYYWNFGDGTKATGKTVTHAFNNAIGATGTSTFPVELTVMNTDGCSAKSTQNVAVKNIPDATLASADINVDTVTFNGFPTFKHCDSLAQYEFKFKNASSTTNINIQYKLTWGYGTPTDTTFSSWGAATVIPHVYPLGSTPLTVSVTGKNGCVAEEKYNIFLGSSPGGGLTNPGNTDYCAGDKIPIPIDQAITLKNPPGTIYTFHVNDGTPDTSFTDVPEFINHVFPVSSCGYIDHDGNQNSFYAVLTMENPCLTRQSYINGIHVSGSSKAKFDIGPDSVGCINTVMNFNNTSTIGNVVSTSGDCFASGMQVWDIQPNNGFILVNGTNTGSINGNVLNTAGWTPGTPNLDIQFTRSGTWTIKLYVTNQRTSKCNFIDSITKNICIQNKPAAAFKFTDLDADACLSDTITFQNNTVDGACINNNYKWDIINNDPNGCSNGDEPLYITGNSTSAAPEVWFKQPGNYSIQLRASIAEACYDTTSLSVIIKGKPKVFPDPINNICVGNIISPHANVQDCYSGEIIKYKWSFPNGSPAGSTQLEPGNILYNVTGTQNITFSASNSCGTITETQTFEVVSKPVANAGNDIIICDDDPKTIGTNTGNYTYSWSPSTGLDNPNVATPVVNLTYTGTSADTVIYTLRVSAGANCDSVDTVRVIVKRSPNITVSNSNPSICAGGSVQVTASGADSYAWNPISNMTPSTGPVVIMNPAITTTYTVTGSLVNGCSNSKQVMVTVNKAAIAEAGKPDSVCNSSSVTIGSNTGNFNYSWLPTKYLSDPSSATPTLTPSGYLKDTTITYYLTADAGAGCYARDSVAIKIKKSPVVIIYPLQPEICVGNSTTVTAQGADEYLWSPNIYINTTTGNRVSITPPATTNYQVTGSFKNGCTNTLPFTTTVRPDAVAAFTPADYSNCAPFNLNSVIQVASYPEANARYIWHILHNNKDSVQQFTSAQAPDYTLRNPGDSARVYLIAISKYGCRNDTSATVTFKAGDSIKALFAKSSNGGCEPARILFSNTSSIVNSSVNFSWDFGNGTTSNLLQPDSVEFITLPESRDTTFYISLIAKNKCGVDSVKDSVKIKPLPVARFGSFDSTTGCSPYNITFNNTSAGNATNYYWDFDDGVSFQTTIDTSVSHKYTTNLLDTFHVRLVAENSCGIDSLTIPVVVAPNTITAQVTTPGNDLYGCAPHTANFINNTTGALNSVWNYGDNTGENLPGNILNVPHTYNSPGTYTVNINFDNGCSKATATQIVNIYPQAEAEFSVLDSTNHIFCFGDTVHLGIIKQTGDYNYLYWGDDNLFYSPPVTSHYYGSLGTYTIKLVTNRVNSIGIICSDTASTVISIGEKPVVGTATPAPIDCFTDEADLLAYGGTYYEWMPAAGLSNNLKPNPVASPGQTTTYTVKITAASGCVQQKAVTVIVNRQPGQNQFVMPGAFTPNGDGLNDCFRLKYSGNVTAYALRIYSRWGELLFEGKNTGACWDGTFKNDKMPSGTYIYTMDVQSDCANTNEKGWLHKKGTIVLIR